MNVTLSKATFFDKSYYFNALNLYVYKNSNSVYYFKPTS